MRYFKAIENEDGEFDLFETMGRAGDFKIEAENLLDIHDIETIISSYCGGPKKITLEYMIDD